MGDVLAAEDLLGAQVRGGWGDGAVDEGERVAEAGQELAAALDEGQVQRVAGEAAGAADALDVVADGAGQGGEHHRGQVADVDAHLQRRGGHQHVGRGGVVGAGLEGVLVLEALGGVQEAGVFAGDDAPHLGGAVEAAVVVVRVAGVGGEGAGAGGVEAGAAVEVRAGGEADGELAVAGGAAQGVAAGVDIRILGGRDDDALRLDGVDGGAAAGLDGVEQLVLGELVQQRAGEHSPGGAVDKEAAPSPLGVPGAAAGDGVEQRLVRLDLRPAHPREGGRGSAGREGRHVLGAALAAPQVPAVAVLGDVPLQPRVPDAALGADAFDDAAGPGGERPVIHVVGEQPGVERVERFPGGVQQVGAVDGDVGAHGAGALEGAAEAAGEAELEGGGEQQAFLGDSGEFGGRVVLLPERFELLLAGGEVGCEQPVALELVVLGLLDGVLHQRGQRSRRVAGGAQY